MDPLQFRANPQALVPKVTAGEAEEGNAGGAYRPPMLNPVAMEDDPDKDTNKRKRRAAEERARRSARSQMISDLAREVVDAPDEVRRIGPSLLLHLTRFSNEWMQSCCAFKHLIRQIHTAQCCIYFLLLLTSTHRSQSAANEHASLHNFVLCKICG